MTMENCSLSESNLGCSSSTLTDWTEFKQWLHSYYTTQPSITIQEFQFGVQDGSVLMHLCGQEICKILKENGTDEAVLGKQLEKIESLCIPKFLVLFQRFRFFTCKQKESDTMCNFFTKLHWLSESCEFASEKENIISDKIIDGVFSDDLRQHLRQLKYLGESNIEEVCRKTDSCCRSKSLCCNLPENENLRSQQNFTDSGFERDHMDGKDKTEHAEKDEDDDIIEIYDREIRTDLIASGQLTPAVDLKGNERKDEELMKLIQQQNVFILDDISAEISPVPASSTKFQATTTSTPSNKLKPVKHLPTSQPKQISTSVTSVSAKSTNRVESANSVTAFWNSQYKKQEKEKLFFCQVCNKGFYSSLTCYQHVRDNHPELTPYKCDICDKSFMLQTSLDEHKLLHNEDQMATCPKCSKKFESARSLERHLVKDHKKDRHTCDICGRSYRFLSGLKLHEMKHTGERPFVCEICGSKHKVRPELTRHMKIHLPEPAFKCPHCPKTFNYKGNLNTHVARHFGEKRFVCHYCGLKINQSIELKYHLRIHTGERPYQCTTCDKTFTRPNHLRRHKRVHTGEKRYSCSICGSKFTRMTNMRSHQRSVHGLDIPMAPTQQVEVLNRELSLDQ